ncbi:hypothetical protein MSG28_007500 [Choristoneura fumiferana]|uniref:Uncharacterized protein n=1 Tax=Choristoneura fumiferana TaxID=7141 RepID=A0ACC0JXE0_CHOFU|nr:hypothetical protein MSG28_007500 [Choristoneura fumiferana]
MPRKNLVHARTSSSAQECRVPDLLRITLQLTRPLSASPARLRRVRGGWRLSATPSPSGFDFRLLLVIIPGVVLILATILDFLETASRRVFLGTTELSCFMTCSDFIIVFLTHLYCEIHATNKIKDYIICLHAVYGYQNMMIVINQLQWSLIIAEMDRTHGLLVPLSHQTGQGNNHISKELNLFLTQVQMRGPAFTPLGVFNISRPVIVVIFSIVATYLALLEQEQHDSELL